MTIRSVGGGAGLPERPNGIPSGNNGNNLQGSGSLPSMPALYTGPKSDLISFSGIGAAPSTGRQITERIVGQVGASDPQVAARQFQKSTLEELGVLGVLRSL